MATTEAHVEISQEAVELWNRSFQGEVRGEAHFAHVATEAPLPAPAVQAALTTLERCAKELVAAAVGRLGLPAEPDPGVLSQVAEGAGFDDHRMIEMLPPIAADYLGT